jgi:putative transposase
VQVCKSIACDLALSIPRGLGAEVPIPDVARSGGHEAYKCVMTFCQQLGCEVVELNVQIDHIHLLVKVPPRQSISDLMGVLKGRTAIWLFNAFPFLRKKPYWGNHFWARGYCIDTVGLNSEMIQKYVRFQEKEELRQEQLQLETRVGPSRKVVCLL